MKLAEIQAQFQAALMGGDTSILGLIPDSPREKKATLLSVYQNAYIIRLVDILKTDFEKLHAYMGDDLFETVAKRYLAANPSHFRSARWIGGSLPDFLRQDADTAHLPVLGDLAALECALNDAFDSADAPVLGFDDLAAVPPQDWGDLCFRPHPCVRVLQMSTNAGKVWSALADGAEPEQPQAGGGEFLMIWRKDHTSRFRALEAEEAMLWTEASRGITFSRLCELAAIFDAAEDASLRTATYLKGWLDSGLLSSAGMSSAVAEPSA